MAGQAVSLLSRRVVLLAVGESLYCRVCVVVVAEIALHPAADFSRIAADLSSKKIVVKLVEATAWAIVMRGVESGGEVGLASNDAPATLQRFPSLEACVATALEISGEDRLYFET